MQAAIDDLWPYTGEMFVMDEVDRRMLERQAGCDLERLRGPWLDQVGKTLATGTLAVPSAKWMHTGGKQGTHSEKLGLLLAEMQFLQRAYPGAKW